MATLQANGITLGYEVVGSGPPLLFITGLGYSRWFWRAQVEAFRHAFTVITFDNRGAGESDKPTGPYSAPMMAADTAALLDTLGVRGAAVVGHSLGGFIAQELVLARPDLVGRLVLAGTSFGGPNAVPIPPDALAVMLNREGDPVDVLTRGITLAAAPGFPERQPERLAEIVSYRLTGPVPPAAYQAQLMAGVGHDAEARLGAIRCPTLILAAEHDRVVPPGNAPLLAARIPGAHMTILPSVGHIFPLESPDATNAALWDFLGRDAGERADGEAI